MLKIATFSTAVMIALFAALPQPSPVAATPLAPSPTSPGPQAFQCNWWSCNAPLKVFPSLSLCRSSCPSLSCEPFNICGL